MILKFVLKRTGNKNDLPKKFHASLIGIGDLTIAGLNHRCSTSAWRTYFYNIGPLT